MNKPIISEEFLQQLESLQMLIKNNVAGMFGGTHKSKTFGSSCEFEDFRDYIPGDDITKIDWNKYARFDKLYLKLYLDERQMHTRIYIDASRSMGYGKGKKDEQALKIAAMLAYLSVCNTDKVSIYVINGKRVDAVISGISGKEAYINCIGLLNDIIFDGDSFISQAILPEKVGYGDGLSVIISDFLTDNDYESAIDYLSEKKRDILCVQVLSGEELNPRTRGKMHLYDSEDNSRSYRKNINREIINAYKRALEYVTGRIRDYCHARGAEYMLVPSDVTAGEIIFGKLTDAGVLK